MSRSRGVAAFVIPAHAGIQGRVRAFSLDARVRGHNNIGRRPSGKLDRERRAFETRFASADGGGRLIHPATPAEGVVGKRDEAQIGRGGRRGGADRPGDGEFVAVGLSAQAAI